MAIEKLLKTTAMLGIALGIGFSSAYGEVFKTEMECEKSVKRVNAKIIGYDFGKDNLALTAKDVKDENIQYIMRFDLSDVPESVMLKGFPIGIKIKFPLQNCQWTTDGYTYKRELFRQIGEVMYAENFGVNRLKLAK